ncbi:MAG: membrane protein insertase YidC [Candidatus Accumulibacter sp.]|jgi:YidC/Oxa1 family membrane protein insertase|nr:membrane protein insertase YidC [Accumulibacter sp.]
MDNRRLILLIVFIGSIYLLIGAWQKYKNPVAPQTASSAVPSAPATPPNAPPASGGQTSAVPPSAGGEVLAPQNDVLRVKTDLYVAGISPQGGDIVELTLNAYKAAVPKKLFSPVERKDEAFTLFGAKHSYYAQSGLIGSGLPSHKTRFTVVEGKTEFEPGADTLQIRLEAPVVDGVKVSKILTFTRGSYLIGVSFEIENGGSREVSAHAYYQLQRDSLSPDGESGMASTFTGPALYTVENKYEKIAFKDVGKGKAKFTEKANDGWIGIVQHYFVSAWIPAENLQRTFYVRNLQQNVGPDGDAIIVSAGVIVPTPTVAPGQTVRQDISLFAGPQLQNILDRLSKPTTEGGLGATGLPLVVDYGWLTIVAAPIFWCLDFIYKMVGNWGWSIIILTIFIKLLFFPLSAAGYKSMAKMRNLAPRMTALKERFGDDKQRLNMEMLNLYKTEKINPFGGCLPIAIQIPVFIALYWALLGAVEMRGAPWLLWIHDLSEADPYFVLPVLMVVTMFIQTKLNPTPPDPTQAKVMMMMPFVFGVMFFFFPSGLVLYWVVSNILSILQQWQITRMFEGGGSGGKAAHS